MNLPIIDRSKYLKGIFILAKINGRLNQREKTAIKIISERLGFSNDFFEETIRNLLRNKHIQKEIVIFSSKKVALSFIEEAFNFISSFSNPNSESERWLEEIAQSNGITVEEFRELRNSTLSKIESH
jgi:DNA-binding Lrp family transcriptional regulator